MAPDGERIACKSVDGWNLMIIRPNGYALWENMREEMDRRGKKIYPNVDFFSASVYYTLGIPMDLFTNLFACARMAGWTAHVKEQLNDNRLIRPKAEYVGPQGRTTAPIAQRA